MKRKLLAAGAAIALAFSLSACGPREPQKCIDRNGTEYVCDDDDDDNDGGWFPVFIPWSQPHQTTHKHYNKPGPAPAPKAPAYKAPAYKAPSAPRPAPRSK